jgi:hypothetical protein
MFGLIGASLLLAGLFVACPFSRQLIVRPFVAQFDSSYVPADVEPMPFDRDLWLAGKARHRVGMAKDLLKNKVLIGMTRAALIEMLGEPDDADGRPRWLLGYEAKGLFDESVWLDVTISPEGTASEPVIYASWEDPRRQQLR